ncbi:MAG: bifunctional DNA-formamidopyrimidine glycosylase/DNA-(apurinic or apyrimidinic site) lyase [Thiotrichales bacterium]|nr:bifunctional DNA-formamidopyrimidine glycosylase/DNA-(apurinic or apyrimidinic site) lyase [Thiotrichales bacterium]
MPELPEVETTRLGLMPACANATIAEFIARTPKLRWPIDPKLPEILAMQPIVDLQRRGKYLLLQTSPGTLLVHLGMSGSLRILPSATPIQKHDHVDIVLTSGQLIRLNDPRRFGAVLWHPSQLQSPHPLLAKLAPEPFDTAFNADYFYQKTRTKQVAIKTVVMDSAIVVGAGNIYANESLFLSGIHPLTPAKSLSLSECTTLVNQIKNVLRKAIEQGGTTLKDFMSPEGKPGYFVQALQVYGREGQACQHCKTPIQKIVINQRASFFCPCCQPNPLHASSAD